MCQDTIASLILSQQAIRDLVLQAQVYLTDSSGGLINLSTTMTACSSQMQLIAVTLLNILKSPNSSDVALFILLHSSLGIGAMCTLSKSSKNSRTTLLFSDQLWLNARLCLGKKKKTHNTMMGMSANDEF